MATRSNSPGENVPQPDPSTLTTAQMDKAVAGLRDILEARISCIKEDLTHHAVQLDTRQVAIAAEVGHLEKLQDEKFEGVKQRFEALKEQRGEAAVLNQKAIDAALQAAKEAVNAQQIANALSIDKSEKATTKQIDQIGQTISVTSKAQDDKFDDLKSRLTTIESMRKGSSEGIGMIGSIFLGAVAFMALVIAIITLFVALRPAG